MKKRIYFLVAVSISFLLVSSCISGKQKMIKRERAARGIGEAHLAKGSFSSALKYLLEAEALYADDHLLQDDLGKVYIAKEKYDIAIKHFKRSIELNPNFAPGKNNLGSAYLLAGKWDKAIEVFEELSSNLLYATPHYPMYNLGWAYYNKKEYKKALVYFKKALKLKRGFVMALRGTGLTYYDLNKPGLAVKYLEKASDKAPRFQQLHFDLANAYCLGKKYDLAIQKYNEVVSIKPDSELSEQAQEKIKTIEDKKSS